MADRFCGSSTNVPRSIMALLMRSARLASRTTGALPMRAALRASAPSRTQPRRWNQQAAAESHIFDETDAMRRQLLYRSKQRGVRGFEHGIASVIRQLRPNWYGSCRLARDGHHAGQLGARLTPDTPHRPTQERTAA